MGHKVHPTGFRLGVVKGWQSRWFAERDYKDILAEDFLVRKVINTELANAAVSRIEIERAAANQVLIKIHTAKPGIVIGRSGEKVERLKAVLESRTKKRVRLEIMEIRQPELDAYLVARNIAEQLEKRISFRRAMKQAVQKSIRANAKGIKVICGGRLGGAEIARSEKEVEGKVPLHTLRADIDYGMTEAHTTFGVIGVKVWIYRGDILPSKRREPGEAPEAMAQPALVTRDAAERRPGGDRRREGGQRGPRPRGDRPQGGERSGRPPGERSPRPPGDRPPRVQGERSPRPPGDRPPRVQGERSPRPPGDRPPRVQGERPARAAERAPQAQVEVTPPILPVPESQVEVTPPLPTPPAPESQVEVTPPTPPAPEGQVEMTPPPTPVDQEQGTTQSE